MANTILSVRDLRVNFSLRGKTLTAVRGASLDLYENETLAIVGESGSGKSVLTKTLIGMTDKNGTIVGGSIDFKGTRLAIRGKRIAMVFQDPMTALNPLKTVGEQIREMITLHSDLSKDASTEKAKKLMEQVGISSDRYGKYPHEFSGGMRQRIVIATAIAADPEVLICDEPTTALDVTLQAQILRLLRDIQRSMGLSVIFITHDLGVVANIADRVAVMYAGEIIETGPTEEVFSCPVHPYTRALLRALPQLGVKGQALFAIPGTPPNLYNDIQGDAFYPRNPEAMEIDRLGAADVFRFSRAHGKNMDDAPHGHSEMGRPAQLPHPRSRQSARRTRAVCAAQRRAAALGQGPLDRLRLRQKGLSCRQRCVLRCVPRGDVQPRR